ncbi:hypothetical protein [Ruminiclostridium cellulolyticum]|uniref:HYR domain-containing protein n=1 Tax=Ruminiclostridium cellulolyticum (strain ATCC 35319 / DSM 5812 / JCM 6584 / H10) TaxID=394503 RepID=B8I0G1_RUMCH|nr:hypothetical protein [Ruminiclostridium cellulolyticum]ACL77487.1 hypothetical protein Ccel_3197 [Ruminiclostridium cellulolyticum H10]
MFGKKTSRAISFLCVFALLFICISSSVFAAEPVKAPKIAFFKASSENVAFGETVTLSWRVLGAREVVITGEEKDVECISEDSIEVWPMVTTTYTLHAYGFNGEEIIKSVTVKVGTAEIKNFTADKTEVAPGEDVTLSWDVFNTDGVSINALKGDNNDKLYAPQGTLTVNPFVTTTYELSAIGFDGEKVTKQMEVKVKDAVINSFTADKTEVDPGEDVTLAWDIANAESAVIKEAGKDIQAVPGTLIVNPFVTTTYTLEVKGYDGKVVRQQVEVKVKAPEIVSFTADNTEVVPGETVNLAWEVKNAKSIEIIGIEKGSELTGTLEVWPLMTTTYVLKAEGYDGTIVTKELTITVTSPLITKFEASKTTIKKGEMVKLTWATKNAVTCSLETDRGQKIPKVNTNGSLSMTPNKTTIFTLTAVDADGNVAVKNITIEVVDK